MRSIFGEYGSFLAELIAGSAVMTAMMFIWPLIRQFMDKVVFLLI